MQLSAPFWQMVPVLHGWPLTHAPHAPPGVHTAPASHAVPASAWPVLVQTAAPELHEIAPFAQTAAGLQSAPSLQPVHEPAESQNPPPQGVPASRTPTETHTAEPLMQSVAPRKHGLINEHGAPGLQPVHCPTLQNPVGHIVPSATAPAVTQLAVPVEHSVTPR